MRRAILSRTESSDVGTFGRLVLDDAWECVTGELPWRNNERGRSCIPEGTYRVEWVDSPKHGPGTPELVDVPGRAEVQIHSGNWCGDVRKGLRSDVLGCVLLGKEVAVLRGQKGVTASRATVAEFKARLESEPFELEIVDTYRKGIA